MPICARLLMLSSLSTPSLAFSFEGIFSIGEIYISLGDKICSRHSHRPNFCIVSYTAVSSAGLHNFAGSEIAGEAAAALAAASLSGASPGNTYVSTAQQLYTFATGPAKGSYMNTSSLGIQIHAALYPSTVRAPLLPSRPSPAMPWQPCLGKWFC